MVQWTGRRRRSIHARGQSRLKQILDGSDPVLAHTECELQGRGVSDILIALIAGLTGLPEALHAVFPQTVLHQRSTNDPPVRGAPRASEPAVRELAGRQGAHAAPAGHPSRIYQAPSEASAHAALAHLATTPLGQRYPRPRTLTFARSARPSRRYVHACCAGVEVLSPSTVRHDRFTRRRLYQEKGVPLYWVIDPDARRAEVWTPEATWAVIEEKELVWEPVRGIEPLRIELEALFGE